MLLNCGAGKDSLESFQQQGDKTSHQSKRKSTLNIHWNDWPSDVGHLMKRADSLEKTLILRKIEEKKEKNDKG